MKKKLLRRKIIIKKSKKHGYGVFADEGIKKGNIIEECYIILTNGKDRKLDDYYFDVDRKYALLTGYGIIYNHADDPNAECVIDAKNRLATFVALKKITKGEEIYISYGKGWFKSRKTTAK